VSRRPRGRSARVLAALVALALVGGLAAVLITSASGGDGRLAVLTDTQAELRRDGVRVRLPSRAPARVYLGTEDGAWQIPASGVARPRSAGETTLRLSRTGRLAAASCVPLRVVVRAGGESTERVLEPEREPCAAPAADLAYTPSRVAPVDPAQLAGLPFGDRSFWLQPWRAWSDTPPATRISAAYGVNFNVAPDAAASAARALARSGVRRARIEIPWGAMGYADPGRLNDEAGQRRILRALQAAGIRPLVLLNANHGGPGPALHEQVRLREAAAVGARTVRLERADAARVRPGLTGFDGVDSDRRPDLLITAVDARTGEATLARPLPKALAAGEHAVTTLRYGPFQKPQLPGGAANPAFEETVRGWLEYTAAVTRFVHETLGSWAFDVEVWNELSFGSDFLDAARYYDPAPAGEGEVTQAILARTVGWLRDRANGIGPIGITDGFAGQTPFASPATSPPGLTALSKHPYANLYTFPADSARNADQRWLDATGAPDASGFVPRYTAYYPEYWLDGVQTETLVRDLAPVPADFAGAAHGRDVTPPGGQPLEMWLTEFNLAPPGVDHTRPGPDGRRARTELTRARTKGLLRSLVAYVHAGVTAIDFYAVVGNDYGLATPAFLASGGRTNGGEPLSTIDRLSNSLVHARARVRARELRVLSVADVAGRKQFDGDGTPAHPTLFDRDVLAVLPFQLSDREWVVPVYVQSRDVRRDLPAEPYRIVLSGLAAAAARASLYDPVTGRFQPVAISAREGDRITVDLPANDSPRLLFLAEAAAG
jgi:hypothetical protein